MWRQNKAKVIITSLATLLPSLIGLILWHKLPELVPIHFNFRGVVDDWAGRPVAVFALPGFFLACQIVCAVAMLHDPRKENTGGKVISILLWVLPVTSIVTCMCIYATALNVQINIAVVCFSLLGVLHIVMGNILPKLRHNYTIGIRTSWTLASQENWHHTHRVAGWSMVITGVIILASALWMNTWLILILLTADVGIPIVYSFVYYKRHGENS